MAGRIPSFQDLVASVTFAKTRGLRASSVVQINHHEPLDNFENYAEEDFRFGFNSAQTTLGAIDNSQA